MTTSRVAVLYVVRDSTFIGDMMMSIDILLKVEWPLSGPQIYLCPTSRGSTASARLWWAILAPLWSSCLPSLSCWAVYIALSISPLSLKPAGPEQHLLFYHIPPFHDCSARRPVSMLRGRGLSHESQGQSNGDGPWRGTRQHVMADSALRRWRRRPASASGGGDLRRPRLAPASETMAVSDAISIL